MAYHVIDNIHRVTPKVTPFVEDLDNAPIQATYNFILSGSENFFLLWWSSSGAVPRPRRALQLHSGSF